MHVLLLQGPMSPFFQLLADDLERAGALVSKINFNGGDEFFFNDPRAESFRDRPESWKNYLRAFILKNKVTLIMGYGDCRYYHRIAKELAQELKLLIYFFEEGYFRPHWVTLERGGVNAHSQLQKIRSVPKLAEISKSSTVDIPEHFWQRVLLCSLYYLAAALRRSHYPFYRHHRILAVGKEAFWWLRAGIRKYLYKLPDNWAWRRLNRDFHQKYYLVPLQIRDDAQIEFHSSFKNLDEFLDQVIWSFSRQAPGDTCLVIKHHPMDRGHTYYGPSIRSLARRYGVADRVIYIHDVANPMLLRQALGLVTINSTMGISGLIHGKKVITLGKAMYDQAGLTFPGTLDDFWNSDFQPDEKTFQVFRQVVMDESQVTGSFYYPKFKFKLPDRFYRDLFGSRKHVPRPLQLLRGGKQS